MRFLAIESLIEGITFVPYALVAFFTIVGVVVLVFNMNGNYGFVYFGIVLFCFIVHIILLVLVQQRLRANEKQKE
jgi:predicted tellurium resistance membrane protein TerC